MDDHILLIMRANAPENQTRSNIVEWVSLGNAYEGSIFSSSLIGAAYLSPTTSIDATFTLQGNVCGTNCTAAAAPEPGTLLLLWSKNQAARE
jgi:hypothetical protein